MARILLGVSGGIADSMLTTSFLACPAPRLVAPAMNDRMYMDAATQANLTTLRELAESGKLKPVIDRTYSLTEAAEAIRYLEHEHARAKVVLTV